jgi:ABC-type methionine transport system ATPase subunit
METAGANNSKTILRAENLERVLDTEAGARAIIKSFSYDFGRGGIYNVVGPSGSGKTSLLRLFNRLDEKTGGDVLFDSRPIEEYPVTELRKKIALSFQVPHLFEGTVTSNLTYCCPDEKTLDSDVLSGLLARVGLDSSLAERDGEKLSVGQKQRVALARSLVQEPEILLLDEPTSALDPGAARTIEELIIRLNSELGLTIIMVTHNFRQAQRLNGVSLLLVDGALIESGSSQDLFTNPQHDLTRRFVRGELR